MSLAELIGYVRKQGDGVVATNGLGGTPEAAYLTFAATDAGEIVFDARPESRKVANLAKDPRLALVIGGHDGTTLQAEGVADIPTGDELDACVAAYVEAWPDSACALANGMVFYRVRLNWARYRDYATPPPLSFEIDLPAHSA